jgi:hypothetical protein
MAVHWHSGAYGTSSCKELKLAPGNIKDPTHCCKNQVPIPTVCKAILVARKSIHTKRSASIRITVVVAADDTVLLRREMPLEEDRRRCDGYIMMVVPDMALQRRNRVEKRLPRF